MYYIVYGILYLFSLLPFPVLYLLSDGITFILAHVIHYRKAIIRRNLSIAFPEKTEAEREQIRKQFYRNFTDNFMEAVKLLSISQKSLEKRFLADNPEVMSQLHGKGKNITAVLGHFFNWEYANQLYSIKVPAPFLVVYMPLKDKIFNRIFITLRSRFQTKLISAHHYAQEIKPYLHELHTVILVGDQNPGVTETAFWAPFFGKMSPFVKGPEKGAALGRHAVVFGSIKKVKRGYYRSHLEVLTENARETENGFVTKAMIRCIERDIREQPANYLWSHNRFRHEFDPAIHSKHVI